jgi:class 3 adenylate cyclase
MSDESLVPAPSAHPQALPGGTVTFLFTDIEGSTRLLRQLRDAYAAVRADHHRLLRGAAAEQGGREVDTQGDAFFFVFARARDGVLAAAGAQKALAAHTWPDDVEVRVRMGLHTGEPSVGDEGYVGLDVVKAARICAAAHGGQVLVSQTTRALIAGDEPEGVGLLNLGEHRLKDIDRREPLFQLVLAGLPMRSDHPRTIEEQPEAPASVAVASGRGIVGQVEAAVRDLKQTIEQSVADELRAAGVQDVSPRLPPSIPGVHRPAMRSEMLLAAITVTVVFGALAAIVIALLVLVL